MPKLKPNHISPTPEEAVLIQAGIDADPDNPEWTDADFARSRPASEMLPEIFGAQVAARMLKPRGRPPLENPKISTTIRIDADVVGAFKATGPGWQPRMNAILREAVEQGRV